MRDFESKVRKRIGGDRRLLRLLSLEKKRRGIAQDSLTFVGMANVAKHWWCTQQAVLQSRAEEASFFSAYLHDRIIYAHRLGFVDALPRSDEALLAIGDVLTLTNVQELLAEKEKSKKQSPDSQAVRVSTGTTDKWEEDPKLRGKVFQWLYAEKYSSIRWNFPWENYTIIGLPDGITANFVYEYKTTRNRFLLRFMKPVAYAQADLYGYFFHRPQKRVQIQVVEENTTETYEETVSVANVEKTLNAFTRVEAGEPAFPPQPWKCRRCDFRDTCPISATD